MRANHLLTQIFLLVALLATAAAPGQIKMVNVSTPPEIKLVPLPSRIVVFQDLESNASQVGREKKEDLINECADSLLSVFAKKVTSLLPSVECIVLPIAKMGDFLKTPSDLQRRYKADLAFGIADFRPWIAQGDVTTIKNYDKSKTKTAEYYIAAGGTLRIYNGDSLLKTFTFSERQFLQNREVVSGLFSVGPSLVKNADAALSVTYHAAQRLAEKFVPQYTSYTVALFKKKELKAVTDLIKHNDYEEAIQKALPLTTYKDEAISSRACYLCALLYHMQTDFTKAFEYAERARKIKKIVAMQEGWSSYYDFLKKYVVDNEVVWK